MTSRPNTRAKSKITGDQFAEFAATRRSTRDFLPTPIPQDVLDEILRDAMTAASWSNTKPILVAVASGEKSKSEELGYGDNEFVPWHLGATL